MRPDIRQKDGNASARIGEAPDGRRRLIESAVRALALSVLSESLFTLISALALRSSGALIALFGGSAAAKLSEPFRALGSAMIVPRPLLPFLVCLLAFILFYMISSASRRRGSRVLLIPGVFLLAVLLCGALMLTLWLTAVNGVRVRDVALPLSSDIRSGAFGTLAAHTRGVRL